MNNLNRNDRIETKGELYMKATFTIVRTSTNTVLFEGTVAECNMVMLVFKRYNECADIVVRRV